MPKTEKPKKVHLIKVQFKMPLTIGMARSVIRRALHAAQAKQLSDKATWEAAAHLNSTQPTVLPIPKAPKPVQAKKRSR